MEKKSVFSFITLNRVGKSDPVQKELVSAYAARKGLSATIVEGRYSKKKIWRERTALAKLIERLQPGDALIVPAANLLGRDAADRISCVGAIIAKKASLHLADSGMVLDGAALGEQGSSLFTLLYLLASSLAAPAETPGKKKKPGRKPKRRRGRPPKRRRPGRPPKKKVGRPKKKRKPGRKPARKKRVSALQGRFKKEILTIRKYLRNNFSVRTIAEMLDMPYQPLRALIKRHPTLSGLLKSRGAAD